MSDPRDLASLGLGLEAIATGNLRFRLDPAGPLAPEFNRMAEQLCQAHEQRALDLGDAERMLRKMVRAQDHLRDTLEEKVRERTSELQRAYEELKKVDSIRDAFISSVSHELRTPLSSIRSFSEILLGYDEDIETRREFLGIINQESERLTRLINDVLDLSRIDAGEMVWRIEATSVPDLCRRVLGTIGVLARSHNQRLDLDSPEGLPEVMADPDRVSQVLTNLLSNAVKFTREGGRILVKVDMPEIESVGDSPGMVRLMVADDGIGIPPEEIDTVFERFRQIGDTLTDKPTGAGLGLTISREIVRHLGGTMWVTSVPGEGSCFYFTLPVAKAVRVEDTGRRAAAKAVRIEPPSRVDGAELEGRVLLVGTGSVADGSLRDALKARGIGMFQAASLAEALDRCAAMRPDLVLIRVPGEGAGTPLVLGRLREDPRMAEIPVLLLAEPGRHRDALSTGAAGVFSTEADPGRLCEEIETFLRSNRRWVAVVDDDPGTVAVLTEMLKLRGYGVVSASNGEEALRIARDRDLDLMILDLNMPRKSGWKVLEALRAEEKTKSLPVIVLTGMHTEMDRTRALALGALEFLEKGHGLERLTSEIELLVKQRWMAAPGEAAAAGE